MVYSAERSARNAENDRTNEPGYCQQQTRMWCGIGPRYGDAITAWRNTNDRHPGNRNPPRGSAVYWSGGSAGHGHAALSLGGGKIRSTDAGGRGRVATVDLGWIERNWHLTYAGWAWDINEVTIPHPVQTAAKKTAKPARRVHIENAIDDINKAIKANTRDAAMVKSLRKQKADLQRLAKK